MSKTAQEEQKLPEKQMEGEFFMSLSTRKWRHIYVT